MNLRHHGLFFHLVPNRTRAALPRRQRLASRSPGVLLCLSVLLASAVPAEASTFIVNSFADAADANPNDGMCATGMGTCTLRAAIQQANALPDADVIQLPAGTYILTIPGQCEDAAATGDLDVIYDLTITGAGSANTIVDPNGIDRGFEVMNTVDQLTMSGLTIRNGDPGPPGGCPPAGFGGGMYNSGTTTLSDVVVTGNKASKNGGGIENDGFITIVDSVITGNTATVGGGLDTVNDAILMNSTVSGNTAASGGGINNDPIGGPLALTNVTLSGNTATTAGGGLTNNQSASLTAVTIAGNAALLMASAISNVGDLTLSSVIIAGTPASGNCSGSMTSGGHNLDSGTSCGLAGPGDLSGMDPQLGPLQNNGGPTPTHALLSGSPAIDAGDPNCPPPATDQRGYGRPVDGNHDGTSLCDIGAFEFGAVPPSSSTTTTTTLPAAGCTPGASFASIDCRLDQLLTTVQTAVPSSPVRAALEKLVMKAKTQTGSAQQALAAGKKKREKAMLGRASRSLGKFKARLGSRKAKKLSIPADALAAMKSAVDQLRTDLATLRSS